MRIWNRMHYLLHRRRLENTLDEELRFHRKMSEEAAQRAGATPEEARREANLAFGNMDIAAEDSRAVWRFVWVESVLRDVRIALRGFRRTPGFAITVILTLALGLGVLASAFSVFNALVLRPFAVKDPYSLVEFLGWGEAKSQDKMRQFSWHEFQDFRQRNGAFSDIIGFKNQEIVPFVQVVTGNYFAALGGRVCMGRPILESDDVPGDAVVVVSYAAWKSLLNGDPNIVGQKAKIGSREFQVVGVACPEFNGLQANRIDFWASLPFSGMFVAFRDSYMLSVVGRLRPGISKATAESILLDYGRQIYSTRRFGNKPESAVLVYCGTAYPLNRESLWVFTPVIAAFGLILLIACANVSNLMLARGLARQREIWIQISIGAGRARMLRQMLTECLLLALAAAIGAFWLAHGIIHMAIWVQAELLHENEIRRLQLWNSAPDWRVFVFLLGAACAATIAFGLAPAMQALRGRMVEANRGEFAGNRSARLRSALVFAQIVVSALLIISAGLALNSERRVLARDVVADMSGVFAITPIVKIDDFHSSFDPKIHQIKLKRLAALPQAAFIGVCGLLPGIPFFTQRMLPRFETESGAADIPTNWVSPEYFSIFGMSIYGRNFSTKEAEGAPVVIVSETAARRLWPHGNALEQTLKISEKNDSGRMVFRYAQVIGIVRDSRFLLDVKEGEGPIRGAVYFPASKEDKSHDYFIIVRMKGDPGSARRILETALNEVARLPDHWLISAQEFLDLYVYPYRALLLIAGFLGVLAMALTITGISGVCSYVVAQRRKEFGIRMALGAPRTHVTSLVIGQSLRLAAAGTAMGVLATLILARVTNHYGWFSPMASRYFNQFDLYDPAIYVAGALITLATATVAAWIPAKRAANVDPLQTLRCD